MNLNHFLFFAFLCTLFSCKSSSDVVNGSFIQKRKYCSGWHVEGRADHTTRAHIQENHVACTNDSTEMSAELCAVGVDTLNQESESKTEPEQVRISDLNGWRPGQFRQQFIQAMNGVDHEVRQGESEGFALKKKKRKEKFTKTTQAARAFGFLSFWFVDWPIHIPIVAIGLATIGIVLAIASLTKLKKTQKRNKFFCYLTIAYCIGVIVAAIII